MERIIDSDPYEYINEEGRQNPTLFKWIGETLTKISKFDFNFKFSSKKIQRI